MKGIAYAPGKIILTGEHFVVYGEPAIVMAINQGIQVVAEERSDENIYISSNLGLSGAFIKEKFECEKRGKWIQEFFEPIRISSETVFKVLNQKCGLNIWVHSDLPIAVGLGSSAALAVATVSAVAKLLGRDFTKEEIIKSSYEAEKYVHIQPSGIDQTISTYGGVIVYSKNTGITHLGIDYDIPIVIGNTGIQRSTGKLVYDVRTKMEMFPKIMVSLTKTAGQITKQAIKALKRGDMKQLGELMDINHSFLMALGVSNEALNRLVNAARESGALGAKLTGAGGGGCMIALSTLGKRGKIAKAIQFAEGTSIIAKKIDSGVKTCIG